MERGLLFVYTLQFTFWNGRTNLTLSNCTGFSVILTSRIVCVEQVRVGDRLAILLICILDHPPLGVCQSVTRNSV